MTETIDIEGKEFEIVVLVEDGGYDWDADSLLRDSSGQLYYFTDSGCSCTSFADYAKLTDLTPVASWQAAVDIIKADDNESHYYSSNAATDFMEACLRARDEGLL